MFYTIFIDVSENKPYNLEEEWSDDTDGSNNDEGKLCYLLTLHFAETI